VTKVDYLLLSHDKFSILSDHLNLAYIFNPTLARHVVQKVATLGTQDACVLIPHGERDERAQLLVRLHDEIGDKVDNRQRAQSALQDGQPLCTAIISPQFCCPDQCSCNSYVDDNSCLISE
jgi:hypothetical protein